MDHEKWEKLKSLLFFLPLLLSMLSILWCAVIFSKVNDIEYRLKTVSLNSYVEQTLVSNNYYVEPGEGGGEGLQTEIVVPGSRQAKKQKVAYLTFDDGPSPNTEKILKTLKRHNVKATFFVDGNADGVEGLEEEYKRIVDEGHTIAMHSYSHQYASLYRSEESFEDDLDKIHSLIYNKTGVDATIYRFPGGSGNHVSQVDMGVFAEALHARGYEYWDWNVYPGSASGKSIPAREIVAGVMDQAERVDTLIILLHDTAEKDTTAEALPEIIEGLLERDIILLPMDMNTPLIQQVSK